MTPAGSEEHVALFYFIELSVTHCRSRTFVWGLLEEKVLSCRSGVFASHVTAAIFRFLRLGDETKDPILQIFWAV